MAVETVIVFAHAMGRTIVLPPETNMYLLSDGLDFHDFFHLQAMAAKHDGMSIISMEVRWTCNTLSCFLLCPFTAMHTRIIFYSCHMIRNF
jgi:hypothetical protein